MTVFGVYAYALFSVIPSGATKRRRAYLRKRKKRFRRCVYAKLFETNSCLCLDTTHPSPNGATFPHKGRLPKPLPSTVAGENCAYFKLYAALSVYCQGLRVCEPSLVRRRRKNSFANSFNRTQSVLCGTHEVVDE